MPAYAQRSPSEALSPSAGPRRDRPTAISSDVWLRPKLHREAVPPPARLRIDRATGDGVSGLGAGAFGGGGRSGGGEVCEWWARAITGHQRTVDRRR
ncbi:hypothetical protein GCM10023086_34170 [Streptomyces venetus]|uniref:Uncharacterized protein n=1 Tax=Streptomyces venetus TaxID=1701086 RepID=A0ABP8FY40_9ACTN